MMGNISSSVYSFDAVSLGPRTFDTCGIRLAFTKGNLGGTNTLVLKLHSHLSISSLPFSVYYPKIGQTLISTCNRQKTIEDSEHERFLCLEFQPR